MFPLLEGLHDEINLLIIGEITLESVGECLTVIGHMIYLLNEDNTNSIEKGIYLNLKWIL